MAECPPELILENAEQERFKRVSTSAQSAAEKLVYFSIPFSQKEAEEVFPGENVGMAVRELSALGLLRKHDQDTFEMHEIVRAGLENLLSPAGRRAAHEALADWYQKQGQPAAEILHWEKAGNQTEAHVRARETFLRGEKWSALSLYVERNKLVSASEIIGVAAALPTIEDVYLLPHVLKATKLDIDAELLLAILRAQSHRFYSDYHWSSAMVESVLAVDSKRLHDLIAFTVGSAPSHLEAESRLGNIKIAMLRFGGTVNGGTTSFFKVQSPAIKRALVEILLLDRRRASLSAAMQFLNSAEAEDNGRGAKSMWAVTLHIDSLEQAVELLASIPSAPFAEMLARRSHMLGKLSNLIWKAKAKLHPYCLQVLQQGNYDELVLENAVRLLVFFAEPTLLDLCRQLQNKAPEHRKLRALTDLLPLLQPAFLNHKDYEFKLMDLSLELEERFTAFSLLAMSNANMSELYGRLHDLESAKQMEMWNSLFLLHAHQNPFREAIALMNTYISAPSVTGTQIIAQGLTTLGQLPGPDVTAMLARALNHADWDICRTAALSLSRRRSALALPALIERFCKAESEQIAVTLATAIVACGATSAQPMATTIDSEQISLWRCILVMRTRDVAEADFLIKIANASTRNWQLRRAAISAAGRLPFDAALSSIVPIVLAERSPLTLDLNEHLDCHSLISQVLTEPTAMWASFFSQGRDYFVNSLGAAFDERWENGSEPGCPTGVGLATWLYDRLSHHGWPLKKSAADSVLNEVNVPMLQSAILRSLRHAQRPDIIEAQLMHAENFWFALKCLAERQRVRDRDPEIGARLRQFLDRSSMRGSQRVLSAIEHIFESSPRSTSHSPSSHLQQSSPFSTTMSISYEQAVRALSNPEHGLSLTFPLILEPVTVDQYVELVRLASPANDPDTGVESYLREVSFTQDGHSVVQRRKTYSGTSQAINASLRPVIAAANSFGTAIQWFMTQLTDHSATSFVPTYLGSLGAMNDSQRFYDMLIENEPLLMPYLCTDAHRAVGHYIDARLAPALLRYSSSGTDEIFEGLCNLALKIKTSEIDPVLHVLLQRWQQRFSHQSNLSQHDQNFPLWRGFDRLVEHPRFPCIKDWYSSLEAALQTPIAHYHAERIVRVLERDPMAYVSIESRLFKHQDWLTMNVSEIDLLDKAAERLFAQLRPE